MTTTFYAPPSAFRSGRVVLPEAEARHAAKVLRLRAGDALSVVDGAGGWFEARLVSVDRSSAVAEVVSERRDVGEPARRIVLALGVLHHRDRFEWAVEKAVELGVTDLVPLRTTRAAPGRLKSERLDGLLISALKQSLRSRLPVLHDEATLPAVLAWPDVTWLLCHEGAADTVTPAHYASGSGPVGVLIGPEGGFSDDEVEAALAAEARLCTLGPRRLRAETAAVAALAQLIL